MKHLLLTTIAAVMLVGCGPPKADQALVNAAGRGNIEAVKQHLAAGTDVNAKDDNGFPPLHLAADRGHTEVVELLITKGAEVNAQSDGGNTPLDWAVDSAHSDEETADLLRKHGGKTGEELESAPQRKTSTALKAASSKKSKLPIPKWAIAAVGGVTVMALVMYFLSGPSVDIWEAARTGNIEAVKQHLAAGADVNAKRYGWTPLHYAVYYGHKEIAELLIAKSADVNARTKSDGDTPLDFSIRNKHTETTDLLRKHGGKTGAELKAEGK